MYLPIIIKYILQKTGLICNIVLASQESKVPRSNLFDFSVVFPFLFLRWILMKLHTLVFLIFVYIKYFKHFEFVHTYVICEKSKNIMV